MIECPILETVSCHEPLTWRETTADSKLIHGPDLYIEESERIMKCYQCRVGFPRDHEHVRQPGSIRCSLEHCGAPLDCLEIAKDHFRVLHGLQFPGRRCKDIPRFDYWAFNPISSRHLGLHLYQIMTSSSSTTVTASYLMDTNITPSWAHSEAPKYTVCKRPWGGEIATLNVAQCSPYR